MNIKLSTKSLNELSANLLVVGIFQDTANMCAELKKLDDELGGIITDFVIKKEGFKAKYDSYYMLPSPDRTNFDKVLIAGLGKQKDITPNKLRVLASKIIQKCSGLLNNADVVLYLTDALNNAEESVKTLTEGAIIGGYFFDKYKTKKHDKKIKNLTLAGIEKSELPKATKVFQTAQITTEAVNMARDLVNEPAQLITPEKIAQSALSVKGVATKVFDKKEIEKMNMGAFLAVGQGSAQQPKFIHMKYAPKKAKKKIAIIGKSITFDSGGLDLKPASSMLTMKVDMSGSAAIIAVMSAIAKLKPEVEVHGIMASCENMPGCAAYKPGDILTAKNGKTVEIDNTDAEGRLTLADALCYAQELGVDEIIDIATLTGACVVALGTAASGIMGNNKKLICSLIKNADDGGERLWELPMYDEYKESLKSDIADMKNTGSRYGGASTAGVFLRNFVKTTPWAHIDIAGTAFLDKAEREYQKGATGVGVRTLVNYLTS